MRLHLFAHNSVNLVKKGDKVEAYGDWIGEIGNANGAYYAHLHYSVSANLAPTEIRSYVKGWSMDKIKQHYKEPNVDRNKMFSQPVDNGQAGYDWLQAISKGYWHPGRDYNGFGGGNSDYGYKFKSPVDGEVIYAGNWGTGWGQVILIKETNMKKANQEFYDSKVKGQGWTTLEDWVEGAREYHDERDKAEKKVEELEDKIKKLEEEDERKMEKIIEVSKKFDKYKLDQIELLSKELAKQKKELTSEKSFAISELTKGFNRKHEESLIEIKEKQRKAIETIKENHETEKEKLIDNYSGIIDKYKEKVDFLEEGEITWDYLFSEIYIKLKKSIANLKDLIIKSKK